MLWYYSFLRFCFPSINMWKRVKASQGRGKNECQCCDHDGLMRKKAEAKRKGAIGGAIEAHTHQLFRDKRRHSRFVLLKCFRVFACNFQRNKYSHHMSSKIDRECQSSKTDRSAGIGCFLFSESSSARRCRRSNSTASSTPAAGIMLVRRCSCGCVPHNQQHATLILGVPVRTLKR